MRLLEEYKYIVSTEAMMVFKNTPSLNVSSNDAGQLYICFQLVPISQLKCIHLPVAVVVAVERVLKNTREKPVMSPDLITCIVTIPALSGTVMLTGDKVTRGTAWEEERSHNWAQITVCLICLHNVIVFSMLAICGSSGQTSNIVQERNQGQCSRVEIQDCSQAKISAWIIVPRRSYVHHMQVTSRSHVHHMQVTCISHAGHKLKHRCFVHSILHVVSNVIKSETQVIAPPVARAQASAPTLRYDNQPPQSSICTAHVKCFSGTPGRNLACANSIRGLLENDTC